MASWSELLELVPEKEKDRSKWIADMSRAAAADIRDLYGRNVLYYASAFLQKRGPGFLTSVDREDLNGFMAGIYGCDPAEGLLLMLHTPGGVAGAAQTIVEYLRSKFDRIDALVPTYAMSAGTMIALGCDRIVMGRQSQLGPTDPQLIVSGRPYSAHSIVDQFKRARADISGDPELARAWAPILRSYGPALLEEAHRNLSYGADVVKSWLKQYMFAGKKDASALASRAAAFFSGEQHGDHGRRIGRDAARGAGLEILDLEDRQELQDAALTLYHLSTLAFERGPATKIVYSSTGALWVKNAQPAVPAAK